MDYSCPFWTIEYLSFSEEAWFFIKGVFQVFTKAFSETCHPEVTESGWHNPFHIFSYVVAFGQKSFPVRMGLLMVGSSQGMLGPYTGDCRCPILWASITRLISRRPGNRRLMLQHVVAENHIKGYCREWNTGEISI